MLAHPVEDVDPALHGDALEHGQHGKPDVVEGGDAVIGPLPLLEADGDVEVAGVCARGSLRWHPIVAGGAPGALRHYLI